MRSIKEIRRVVEAAVARCRQVWLGDDGALRVGHSGDVVAMFDDMCVPAVGHVPPSWIMGK